jgi:hypothetical protein
MKAYYLLRLHMENQPADKLMANAQVVGLLSSGALTTYKDYENACRLRGIRAYHEETFNKLREDISGTTETRRLLMDTISEDVVALVAHRDTIAWVLEAAREQKVVIDTTPITKGILDRDYGKALSQLSKDLNIPSV